MIDTPAFNEVRSALALAGLAQAEAAFEQIESEVETLIRELEGEREASRQLRTALEEPDPLYR